MSIVAVAGSTFTYYLPGLEDQANAGLFKSSPTIGAADFTISVNGGAFEAMDNTPTVKPTGGKQIEFVLSVAETTAAGDGGTIVIQCSDAAGAEWYDVGINVPVRTADLAVVGSAMTLASGAITASTIATDAITAGKIAADAIGASELAATAAAEIAAAVIAGGAGTYSYSNTVDDGSGNLIDGAYVELSTNSGFTNVVNATHTNSLGAFTVYSDTAGTHYLRITIGGYEVGTATVTLA